MQFSENLSKNLKINLNEKQLEMFSLYYDKLIEYNTHTNLTRIVDKKDVYYKHFYDSLTIAKYITKKDAKLCDMGSGAGFPGIPLKIIFPNLKVTIIDSSIKKVKFLKEVVELLKLNDVEIIHDRIEVYGQKNNQKFNYVTARALGKTDIILEFAIPMLIKEGIFLIMKSNKGIEEINDSNYKMKMLKSKLIETNEFNLPFNYGFRTIFIIKKTIHVNGYPRTYQQILKEKVKGDL